MIEVEEGWQYIIQTSAQILGEMNPKCMEGLDLILAHNNLRNQQNQCEQQQNHDLV